MPDTLTSNTRKSDVNIVGDEITATPKSAAAESSTATLSGVEEVTEKPVRKTRSTKSTKKDTT